MLKKKKSVGKWSLSSVRILKQCFSPYGDFNVLLQSALQPGFRMVFNVLGTRAEQYSTHTAQTEFVLHTQCNMRFVLEYTCSTAMLLRRSQKQ